MNNIIYSSAIPPQVPSSEILETTRNQSREFFEMLRKSAESRGQPSSTRNTYFGQSSSMAFSPNQSDDLEARREQLGGQGLPFLGVNSLDSRDLYAVISSEMEAEEQQSIFQELQKREMLLSGEQREGREESFGDEDQGNIPSDSEGIEGEEEEIEEEYEKNTKQKKGTKKRNLQSSKKLETVTLDELSKYYHLPISEACRLLGVGQTVLKKKCRSFGIRRWPYRKMKSLDTLIGNIQDLAKGPDGNTLETVQNAVKELESEKKTLEEMPAADLAERTKKLRQACFKASYKKRKYTVTNIAPREERESLRLQLSHQSDPGDPSSAKSDSESEDVV